MGYQWDINGISMGLYIYTCIGIYHMFMSMYMCICMFMYIYMYVHMHMEGYAYYMEHVALHDGI